MKIFKNIIENPTQTQKYGDLHFGKIGKKFAKCKPALDLLLLCGFKKSNDGKRLIWTDSDNNNGISLLNHVQHELKSMIGNDENIDSNEWKQPQPLHFSQTQQVCNDLRCN